MMVIPEGFAHGFQSLTEDAKMLYLHTACYAPEHEQGLRYDDPMLNINWPLDCSEISERDKVHSYLKSDFAGISQ
jgi:dTDP-4-dehydrorhamnose 3,5-epimerase